MFYYWPTGGEALPPVYCPLDKAYTSLTPRLRRMYGSVHSPLAYPALWILRSLISMCRRHAPTRPNQG